MARIRPIVAAAIALVLASAGAGCSSDSGHSGSRDSGLAAALDSVTGSGPAATYFEYGDTARLRALGVLDPGAVNDRSKQLFAPRWSTLVALGAGSLASYSSLLPGATGLDPYAADSAVTIGQPPNAATKLTGSIDSAAITTKLTALGARPRKFGSTKGLSFGADNSIDATRPLNQKIPLVDQLDQVAASDHQVVVSPNAASLQKALGGGTSLLHTGSYAKIADCLGDVVAAIVTAPSTTTAATVVAVGVRNPTSTAVTQHEVLCLQPASGRQSAVRAAVANRLTPSAVEPTTRSPLSTMVSATRVSTVGSLVRAVLTLRPTTPIGYLIQGIFRGEAGYWAGSCTAAELAQRHSC